ncbi:hypothetical protein [Thiomonas bhubaneswarensis]|uniref:Uncharacterized protein n=1 Tax=Thiomonas bhubaneswarensis TaxID=339866 RepID=A0A0K6HZU9_9BURK|nr:hypothetical protein [Thiomonas bhubaneswarensis]CUA96405.1 hypothetical protein Ga0061069_104122 [Thiomonas bhubaneswarensis]
MAYSNSEQIFIDAIGALPTEDQWKDIRSLLGILSKAGFEVDDPSNAPHVTLFAWGWARSTGRADVLAAVKAAVLESAGSQAPSTLPADFGPVLEALTALRAAPVRIDLGVLRDALRESISTIWLLAGGLLLAFAFWAGMLCGQREMLPLLAAKQQTIDQLSARWHAR